RNLSENSGQATWTYLIVYNYNQKTKKIIIDASPLAPYPTGDTGGWRVSGPTRVSVTRTGNIYSIKTSQFKSTVIDDATEVIIDIDQIPELEPFTVATRVGFSAASQKRSSFTDIFFTGLIDYIFWDKETFYETYEYDRITEEYFLQDPKTVTV